MQLLLEAYAAYSRQDVDGLLALVSEDVDWPDGVNRLRGRAAVRAYWLDQWTRTRTHDHPVAFTRRPDGRIAVRVSQVVRTLDGALTSTGSFDHLHLVIDGRLVRLDISEA